MMMLGTFGGRPVAVAVAVLPDADAEVGSATIVVGSQSLVFVKVAVGLILVTGEAMAVLVIMLGMDVLEAVPVNEVTGEWEVTAVFEVDAARPEVVLAVDVVSPDPVPDPVEGRVVD